MDQSRAQLLQRFKRVGFLVIMVPALLVAAAVSVGVRRAQIDSYGLMLGRGLNGVALASMRQGESIKDPKVFRDLKQHLESLVDEGSFEHIVIVSTDGDVIMCSDDREMCEAMTVGFSKIEKVLSEDRAYAGVENGVGRVLLVVSPLRTSPWDEPYAVGISTRPYSLVRSFLDYTSAVIGITVLAGAALTYALLRFLVHQAEQEFNRQEQRVMVMNTRLGASLQDIEAQSVGTLQALVAAVDAKDSYTARHSLNVADYAVATAVQLGRLDLRLPLERAGLLHDIGKIGVPESLLDKPSSLSAEEFASVKEHASAGGDIVTAIPFLQEIVPIIRHHHERMDGTGYPDGVAGEDIPFPARILAVVDAFDAMTTERPYRKAMATADAIAELMANRGTQFDAAVVDAFTDAVRAGRIRCCGDPA